MTNILHPTYCQTQCYKQPCLELYNEDCLKTLERLETGSVDLMLQDPPYGSTQNDWDNKPFLAKIWFEWERVIKDNGAIVFTAQQPFTSELVLSRPGFFRYSLIWEKTKAGGFLNANKMPLQSHEDILVFYKSLPTYNPQMMKGEPYIKKAVTNGDGKNYGKFERVGQVNINDGKRYPRSVITFENDNHDSLHPTQKPVDLFRYLIKTYSNEGDLVFDGYSGSGTTAAACLKEKRRFIGSELNKEYFNLSVKRLEEIVKQPELF